MVVAIEKQEIRTDRRFFMSSGKELMQLPARERSTRSVSSNSRGGNSTSPVMIMEKVKQFRNMCVQFEEMGTFKLSWRDTSFWPNLYSALSDCLQPEQRR